MIDRSEKCRAEETLTLMNFIMRDTETCHRYVNKRHIMFYRASLIVNKCIDKSSSLLLLLFND